MGSPNGPKTHPPDHFVNSPTNGLVVCMAFLIAIGHFAVGAEKGYFMRVTLGDPELHHHSQQGPAHAGHGNDGHGQPKTTPYGLTSSTKTRARTSAKSVTPMATMPRPNMIGTLIVIAVSPCVIRGFPICNVPLGYAPNGNASPC